MYPLRKITIKTQARILKYFTVIVNQTNRRGVKPEIIRRRAIKWTKETTEQLKEEETKNGIITEKERAFENYLDASKKLSIVGAQKGLTFPSKLGMVLKKITEEEIEPTFELNNEEKIFYAYILLKNDADYLLTVLNMVCEFPGRETSFYLESFKKKYKERLEEKVSLAGGSSYQKTFDALNKVKQWRSPKRYSEDIVPPRLNWLNDLKWLVVEKGKNKTYFPAQNIKGHLRKKMTDIGAGNLDMEEDWLEKNFFSFYTLNLNSKKGFEWWSEKREGERQELIKPILSRAYNNFKSIGAKRLSLEQTLLFISLELYKQNKVICEIKDLKDWIGFERKIGDLKYGIRERARDYESYLVIGSA